LLSQLFSISGSRGAFEGLRREEVQEAGTHRQDFGLARRQALG